MRSQPTYSAELVYALYITQIKLEIETLPKYSQNWRHINTNAKESLKLSLAFKTVQTLFLVEKKRKENLGITCRHDIFL